MFVKHPTDPNLYCEFTHACFVGYRTKEYVERPRLRTGQPIQCWETWFPNGVSASVRVVDKPFDGSARMAASALGLDKSYRGARCVVTDYKPFNGIIEIDGNLFRLITTACGGDAYEAVDGKARLQPVQE